MEKWRCKVCGYIYDGILTPYFVCPQCRNGAEAFDKMPKPASKNPYIGTKTGENWRFGERDFTENRYEVFVEKDSWIRN